MVNVDGFSIAAAGVEFGVGWHVANNAVAEHTDPAFDDPTRLDGVRGIGVDEKRFLNATAEHRTVFTTQIVDLDRHRLLDVLADWLAERGPDWCAQISATRTRGAPVGEQTYAHVRAAGWPGLM